MAFCLSGRCRCGIVDGGGLYGNGNTLVASYRDVTYGKALEFYFSDETWS